MQTRYLAQIAPQMPSLAAIQPILARQMDYVHTPQIYMQSLPTTLTDALRQIGSAVTSLDVQMIAYPVSHRSDV